MVPAPLDRTPQKVTVCGGGTGAQTLVPVAAGGLRCRVDIDAPFAGEAAQLRNNSAPCGGIEVTGAVVGKALPCRVSAHPVDVILGSEVVVLVLPAFAHENTLRQIATDSKIARTGSFFPNIISPPLWCVWRNRTERKQEEALGILHESPSLVPKGGEYGEGSV
jgi:hypothetical protein